MARKLFTALTTALLFALLIVPAAFAQSGTFTLHPMHPQ